MKYSGARCVDCRSRVPKNSLSKIPFWDGNAESFRSYVGKIKAYAEFTGVGDTLDPDLMKNCPTQLELVVLDILKPDNQQLIELYQANKKL